MRRLKTGANEIVGFGKTKKVLTACVAAVIALVVSSVVLGVEYKNIFTDYAKPFAHFSPPGRHSDTESYKYDYTKSPQQNLERRHANCNDCHDAHSATRAASPLGSYFGAGAQANVSGVKVTQWDSNLSVDSDIPTNSDTADDNTFAFVSSVVKEYELCFKCHTRYSFEFMKYKTDLANTTQHELTYDWTLGDYVPMGTSLSDPLLKDHILVTETDLAREFNPQNKSYHPVVERGVTRGEQILVWAGKNSDGAWLTFNDTFAPGISADSRIKCTDCHTSDATGVKGPHGSIYRYILSKRAPTDEPMMTKTGFPLGSVIYGSGPSVGAPFPLRDTYEMTWYVRTNDNLCYNCHDVKYYGAGKGHPSHGKHWNNCQWHRPIAMDQVGCASCKITPIHGSATNAFLMLTKAQGWTTPENPARYNPSVVNWCFNCHDYIPGQPGSHVGGGWPSCPRFYSVDKDGVEQEETRVHFQSARVKAGAEYFIPLPTPDMPNLKGLGNLAEYRYYNREDDYTLFRYGAPKEEGGLYKIRFDQPSTGDRPDGEPVAEVGYEDSIRLLTADHAKDTQVYLSVDGDVIATKSLKTAKRVTDNLGNDITDVINTRTSNKDDRSGWFQGTIGYGNTIEEIYKAGNSFVMDFGDLSTAKTVKLVWGVNEEKGGKLPVFVQTKDAKGDWVTRGSARHSEDRYGYIDLKQYFPKGTRDYRVKIIPTLNSIDFMAISTKDEPVKVTTLVLKRADYRMGGAQDTQDVTAALSATDKNYVTFDYMDTADLFFDIPAYDKTQKRDFIFAPTGYYETGGDIPANAVLDPMTAEKAQDFGVLTPAGGYANHYNVGLIDPGDWNDRFIKRTPILHGDSR